MVTLCIDNRERDRIALFQNYIKSGKTQFIDNIETGNYQTGDYFSKDGLVGIEYKKDDFLPCVFDETIDKQLKELKDNFPHHFLFIGYKGIDDMLLQNLGTSPNIIVGKLASIVARTDTPIIFVGDLLVPFVCKVIERFYDGKTILKETSYTPIRRSATTKEVRLDIISRIPNVGPKKGLKLLEAFDYSILNIAKAEIEDLKKVKGIGDSVANAIKETLK